MNQRCDIVRATSFAIHTCRRNGHLEKIYRNALVNRLRKQELNVQPEYESTYFDDDGTEPGTFYADLMIERRLIVEINACREIAEEHVDQLLGYLRSSRIETGLLINFGSPKLYIKKSLMTPMGS
jgi:GxxExxY protein